MINWQTLVLVAALGWAVWTLYSTFRPRKNSACGGDCCGSIAKSK